MTMTVLRGRMSERVIVADFRFGRRGLVMILVRAEGFEEMMMLVFILGSMSCSLEIAFPKHRSVMNGFWTK